MIKGRQSTKIPLKWLQRREQRLLNNKVRFPYLLELSSEATRHPRGAREESPVTRPFHTLCSYFVNIRVGFCQCTGNFEYTEVNGDTPLKVDTPSPFTNCHGVQSLGCKGKGERMPFQTIFIKKRIFGILLVFIIGLVIFYTQLGPAKVGLY